jgi:hypothetical protein
LIHRAKLSTEERLAADRSTTQAMLEGAHAVPTKVCVHCGSRAKVQDGQLEMSWKHRGHNGSAVVPQIVICLDGCRKATVRRTGDLGTFTWCYGAQEVTLVDGPAFVQSDMPVMLTARQRERGEEFLELTAPR